MYTEEISALLQRLRNLDFPNLEDGSGKHGSKTWDKAFEMVQNTVGCGFELKMNKKTRVRFGPALLQFAYVAVAGSSAPSGVQRKFTLLRLACAAAGCMLVCLGWHGPP